MAIIIVNDDSGLNVPAGSQTVPGPVTIDGTLTATGILDAAQIGRTWQVNMLASAGTGTLADPWTGWEASVNALPVNVHIHFAGGRYTQTAMIDVKDRWCITGDGRGATVITSAMAGTAFRLNTVASPAYGYISIRDLSVTNTNAANTGSGILVVGAFFSDISDVTITGFRFAVTEINAEIFACHRVTMQSQLRACLWIVNNGDYNLTYADLDYSAYTGGGTNAVSFYDCQFNGSGTNTPFLVIDDGGYNHSWYNCNFNVGGTAFRFAGCPLVTCVSADFEGQTSDLVVTINSTYHSGAGVGPNFEIVFQANMMTPLAAKACFDATSVQSLILIGNHMTVTAAAVKNASGCNLFSLRSDVIGGSLYSGTPGSYFDLASNNAANALATSLPILTSGDLSVTLIGKGLRVAAGTNGRLGSSVLVGGTVVVANTSVTAATKVFISRSTAGGTAGTLSYTKIANTSFTITSSSGTDTSTIEWMLIEAL